MNHQSYYVRERDRITGPFNLDQLREMRRANRLARFHMVSADGRNWVHAETLAEVFHPAVDPPTHQAGAPAAWFYFVGDQVHGPVGAPALQELIDRGAVGPDVMVRQDNASQWSPCGQVGGFRFGPLPAAPPAEGHADARRVWIVSSIVGLGLAAAVLFLAGRIAWDAGQHRGKREVAAKVTTKRPVAPAVPEAESKAAAPTPGGPPVPKPPEPAPVEPGPVARSTSVPDPDPDPAIATVKDVKFANVGLPRESENASRHDSADHALEVTLPVARRYALRLRGLNDPETQKFLLVARPTEPGRADMLTVIRDPAMGGGKASTGVRQLELARFWIEGALLHFRWAASLHPNLIEPAKALHDCILEVRGGGVQLNVVLREVLLDPQEISVLKGSKAIAWDQKSDRPSRNLVIRSCEVRIRGDWKDVPEQVSPTRRQLTVSIPGEAGDTPSPAVKPLILSVSLIEDGSKFRSELDPSTKKNKTQLDQLKRDLKRLQEQKTRFGPGTDDPEQTLKQQQFVERVKALQEQGREAEIYRSALIRVRLGIIVDGDEIEVARIGPK